MTGSDQPRPSVSDVIARLEAATGADRELEKLIALACGWSAPDIDGVCGPNYDKRDAYKWRTPTGEAFGWFPPAYTASLDAALALVGEKLPEWWPELILRQSDASAKVCAEGNRAFYAKAPTPALAVLLALFRALPREHD